MESTLGLMEEDMKVSILKTRNTDKANTFGLMVDATMVHGLTVDNMVKASTQHNLGKLVGWVFGMMVKEKDGLIKMKRKIETL
tara:strand:+ start:585 stop:833 length:249 start_codon:yes stop_codon:yes gene_type:complete